MSNWLFIACRCIFLLLTCVWRVSFALWRCLLFRDIFLRINQYIFFNATQSILTKFYTTFWKITRRKTLWIKFLLLLSGISCYKSWQNQSTFVWKNESKWIKKLRRRERKRERDPKCMIGSQRFVMYSYVAIRKY